jgi:hypothetical protein
MISFQYVKHRCIEIYITHTYLEIATHSEPKHKGYVHCAGVLLLWTGSQAWQISEIEFLSSLSILYGKIIICYVYITFSMRFEFPSPNLPLSPL